MVMADGQWVELKHMIVELADSAGGWDAAAVSDQELAEVLRRIYPLLAERQEWFYVFRILAEGGRYNLTGYEAFCQEVRRLYPDCPELPYRQSVFKLGQFFSSNRKLLFCHCPKGVDVNGFIHGCTVANTVMEMLG